MADSLTERFDAFFSALWGFPPFGWQRALAERVLTDADKPWPKAIALPTAAGKTACIDIAVFALAAQADRLATDQPITAPRRIFFVVDRRVIVDEAHARAKKLAKRLRESKDQPDAVRWVAERLRTLARGGDQPMRPDPDPLGVFELRGGMYRSEAWARSPLQPIVVASTVDQFGSRLLFRAYGRGFSLWPVYAALTGNDALVLLDEAHCAQPFMQTLHAVEHFRTWAEAPLPPAFHPVVLSATPPQSCVDDVFHDATPEPRDPEHPLGRRQLARKPVRLQRSEAKGKRAAEHLAKDLAKAAEGLATGPRRAIVIFVNRVTTARATHQQLAKRHPGRAVLLTGRMRPIDKERVIAEQLKPLASSAPVEARNAYLAQPLFVLATQTLEVGADLDFDGLVSECASLDALRQRFGRLNRTGRLIDGANPDGHPIGAEAVIVVRADQAESGSDDPVYGEALSATWQALEQWQANGGELDFGIAHLDVDALIAAAETSLTPTVPNAPVLLPSHLDALVQTSPEPEPTPDVALFLHGPRRGNADVQICWRADIDLAGDDIGDAVDSLALCPPAAAECLPVPIAIMRAWLEGAVNDETSDIQGTAPTADSDTDERITRRVLRWSGRGGSPARLKASRDLAPGDILVIPAATDGHEGLGDLFCDEDGPRLDLGDQAHLSARAKVLLRLHPKTVATWPASAARDALIALLKEAHTAFDEDPDALTEQLQPLLHDLAGSVREAGQAWLAKLSVQSDPDDALGSESQHPWTWLVDALDHVNSLKRRQLRRLLLPHPNGGLIIKGTRLLAKYLRQAESFTDEDDASASGTTRVPLLPTPEDTATPDAEPRGHLHGVERYARRFAAGCQLPAPITDALGRAALLHDTGKADPRFQALLHGGNPWATGPLLAKSGELPQGKTAYNRVRAAAGYPIGGRHELLSVRLAESGGEALLGYEPSPGRDMILHLIASHHGRCRPFAPVIDDQDARAVELNLDGALLRHEGPTELERIDAGVAERFWRQVRRYGWWGSAWLEAMLRLADHRRSEAEQEQAR